VVHGLACEIELRAPGTDGRGAAALAPEAVLEAVVEALGRVAEGEQPFPVGIAWRDRVQILGVGDPGGFVVGIVEPKAERTAAKTLGNSRVLRDSVLAVEAMRSSTVLAGSVDLASLLDRSAVQPYEVTLPGDDDREVSRTVDRPDLELLPPCRRYTR
jgi:hypothetical protein